MLVLWVRRSENLDFELKCEWVGVTSPKINLSPYFDVYMAYLTIQSILICKPLAFKHGMACGIVCARVLTRQVSGIAGLLSLNTL